MLRRAFLATSGAALTLPLTGCGAWAHDLHRAGALTGALRHIRHLAPAKLAGAIVLTMPSTVAVHLATEDDRAYTTLQWQQGRVHATDDTGMIPEAFTLFDLLHDMPLVADIQHMAQRHLGVEGVFAPDLDTATLWIEDEAVLVEARLHDVHDSIRLRVNGATLTRA